MTTTMNSTLLTRFAAAVERAERVDVRLTPEAADQSRAEQLSAISSTFLPQASELLDQAERPVDRSRLQRAFDVDPATIAMKWPQVKQLVDAGMTLEAVTAEAADVATIAAIVEHAESYLQAEHLTMQQDSLEQLRSTFGTSGRSEGLEAVLQRLFDTAARQAVALGHSKAQHYLDARARSSFDQVIASKIIRTITGGGNAPGITQAGGGNIAMMAPLWEREAQTNAAKVLGVATPNERDLAAKRDQDQRDFAEATTGTVPGTGYAPGESPSELAARVPRGY